ncbi:MAG: chemotaxis protein CheW [Burkholderiales bacterium]|nr:chemotaxis protein CheW [Burkholderiales bacterium]
MSNREALRELQGRLAQRLQQARTETRVQSWLAVECAGLGLLLPLPGAGEIFPFSPLLPVPHTQAWFLGVANLRGGLHGVVDLAAFLGLRAPLAPDAVREGARLLAFNPAQGARCAVLVDRLAGLRSPGQLVAVPDGADPAPNPAAARPAFAGPRWRDEAGRAWQEIDLAALARHEQFLAIAA